MNKFLKPLFSLLFFIGHINQAQAIDTYNGKTNRLTIKSVIVGDMIFHDVTITINKIISIGGSSLDKNYINKATSTPDSFDPQNLQLSIPNVTAFGNTFYDVVIKVGDVLGVGDATTVQDYNAQINNSSIVTTSIISIL